LPVSKKHHSFREEFKMKSYISKSTFTMSAVTFLMFIFPAAVFAASFQGLGDLGGSSSRTYGISADGSVVVGESYSPSGKESFRWTSAGGMTGLGDLPGGDFYSTARGVSADGSVVVGFGTSASGYEAFRWTAADGLTPLGDLPGGSFDSRAWAISADGSTIVGGSSSSSGLETFRWTSATGMTALGYLPGGDLWGEAYAVSADGSVVFGESGSSPGPWEAFRWTSTDGMTGMGDLPGGIVSSRAHDVSADGSVVIGSGYSDSGHEACRWSSADGLTGLGDFPGGDFWSEAYGVSADGSVIVGFGTSDVISLPELEGEAFYWTPEGGMQNLKDMLTDCGLDLTGWTLKVARDVSADGSTIVGYGTNPQGQREAWIATVPEPASGVIFALGSLFIGLRRKQDWANT
jgi:probable HAF family extracellular repeat protein